jgi:hypothetical protein
VKKKHFISIIQNSNKNKKTHKNKKIKKLKVSKKTKTWTKFKETGGLHSGQRSRAPTSYCNSLHYINVQNWFLSSKNDKNAVFMSLFLVKFSVAHFMANMRKVVGLTVVFSSNFMRTPFAEHILFYFWEKINTTLHCKEIKQQAKCKR